MECKGLCQRIFKGTKESRVEVNQQTTEQHKKEQLKQKGRHFISKSNGRKKRKGQKKIQKQEARKKECIVEEANFGQIRKASDEKEGKDLGGEKEELDRAIQFSKSLGLVIKSKDKGAELKENLKAFIKDIEVGFGIYF